MSSATLRVENESERASVLWNINSEKNRKERPIQIQSILLQIFT